MQQIALVGGCPRSGTSALAKMLSCHPDVAISHERFGGRARSDDFGPADFVAERAREHREGDCAEAAFAHPTTRRALDKRDSATVVGDKLPYVSMLLDAAKKVAGCKVVAIIREPAGMAESFQERFRRKSDPFSHDFRASVRLFNEGMALLRDADPEADGYSLMVVEYHQAFTKPEVPKAIFKYLGVDPTVDDSYLSVQREFIDMGLKVAASGIRGHVARTADYAAYRANLRKWQMPLETSQ
jgi:hypothetical protein